MKNLYLAVCITIFTTSHSLAMQRLNAFRKMLFFVQENMTRYPAPTKFIAEEDQNFKEQLEAHQSYFFSTHFKVLLASHAFKKEEDVLIGNTMARTLNISKKQLENMSAAQFVAKLNEIEKDTPETLAIDSEIKRMIQHRTMCTKNA